MLTPGTASLGLASSIPQGGDGDFELSGKVGGSVDVSSTASIYGEVAGTTTSGDPAVGLKAGIKYGL